MNVVLISTYELGHQPFGLASPAAWLAESGAHVTCMDLSREDFREEPVRAAEFIAFYVPMHTATRLAVALLPHVQALNPRAHICFYGLYAPVNADYLRSLGADSILGGEFEEGLAYLVGQPPELASVQKSPNKNGDFAISLARQQFRVPERGGLPSLEKYAHLILPDGSFRVAGYTEASRGCKHLCRHCPIVPVYDGAFRIVQKEIVLEDIRRQVKMGAHAMAIVEEMHREFPDLSYDATIKIEHLLKHADLLPKLRDTGCLFVTSAVESVDDLVLEKLAKGHTRADFISVAKMFRETNLTLQPTFVPFNPWTKLDGYLDLLAVLAQQDLIENVAPIQLAIRLLIPAGSKMLDLAEIRNGIDEFDPTALAYPWRHRDPRVDALAREVGEIVEGEEKLRRSRAEIFVSIWEVAARATGHSTEPPASLRGMQSSRRATPHMNEPWYCCAEPTRDQLVSIGQPKNAPTEHSSPQPDAFV
jgi:hypothetical protein